MKADTINKILKLGRNDTDFTEISVSANKKQKIIENLQDIQLLVIDEISMLTPVTLTKINFYLKSAFNNDYEFGGLSILLIGDMYQFPPVDKLSHAALYQAAVALGMGLSFPNTACRTGAETFIKFRLVILNGQARASPEFNEWLNQIRNPYVDHPITDEWLDQLKPLKSDDFKSEEVDWSETPIVVTGNMERFKFLKEKVKEFAVKTNQGAICWYCPVKKAAGCYEVPETDLSDVYGGLTQYFVRGAQCVLTKSLETKLGLGKESPGIMIDAIWNDENKAVDIDNLEPGTVTKVSQPDYLIIKIFIDKDQHEIICTRPKRREFEDKQQKRVYRSYKGHQVDLAAAITYHKMQGKTLESIILSLNSIRGVSNKLCGLTLPSLYVGCS